MAFPTGWGRRAALTIDNTQVSGSGDHTNMPVLWTVDNLPSEMFDADGSFPALSGGGDIRFTSDEAGSSLLSIDVVLFTIDNDPANGTALIWCKVPTVDFNDDTVIYVWYNKSGESQPAASTVPGGSEDVWADYSFASHDGVTDDSGNGTIADSGTTTAAVGPFGNSGGARRSTGDYLTFSVDLSTLNEPFTTQAWAYVETGDDTRVVALGDASATNQQANLNFDDSPGVHIWDGTTNVVKLTGGAGLLNAWRQIIAVFASDTVRSARLDGGAQSASGTDSVAVTGLDRLRIFKSADSTPFGGQPLRVAEARMRRDAVSDDWFDTEFNNQDAPGTFASAGTPESPVAPTGNPRPLTLMGVG